MDVDLCEAKFWPRPSAQIVPCVPLTLVIAPTRYTRQPLIPRTDKGIEGRLSLSCPVRFALYRFFPGPGHFPLHPSSLHSLLAGLFGALGGTGYGADALSHPGGRVEGLAYIAVSGLWLGVHHFVALLALLRRPTLTKQFSLLHGNLLLILLIVWSLRICPKSSKNASNFNHLGSNSLHTLGSRLFFIAFLQHPLIIFFQLS